MTLPLVYAMLIGVASYLTISTMDVCRRFLPQLTSFTAGVAVTYVFLQLFPEFVDKTSIGYHPSIFLTVLGGFSGFYMVEKYIYQHSDRNELMRELAIEDSIITFIYHFIVGILLVEFTEESVIKGTLFFFPVFLNTAFHALPVDVARNNTMRMLLSVATMFGVLTAALIFQPSQVVTTVLTGFIVGTLIFSVIRHSLPSGRKGRPIYFLLGMFAYSLVIVLTWELQGV